MNEKEIEKKAWIRMYELARQNHPSYGLFARWGGGVTHIYRICNICDEVIEDSGFDGHYARTKQSIKAEDEHMEKHLQQMIKDIIDKEE